MHSSRKVHWCLVLCTLPAGGLVHGQQEVQRDGIVLSAGVGSALPLGTFSSGGETNTGIALSSAQDGTAISFSALYLFAPRWGARLSIAATRHQGSANYSGRYPWVCQPCGHGYIRPEVTTSSLEVGQWTTDAVTLGVAYMFREGKLQLSAHLAAGLQQVGTPDWSYSEEGVQYMNTGSPPFSYGSYQRSFYQGTMKDAAPVLDMGIEMHYPLFHRIKVFGSIGLFAGGVRMQGEQRYQFSGATQSVEYLEYDASVDLEQSVGTTRIVVQLGVAIGLGSFRGASATP